MRLTARGRRLVASLGAAGVFLTVWAAYVALTHLFGVANVPDF